MITKRSMLVTKETNPFRNLALEEYLTYQVEEDEVILYLWQNQHTVVIGKNQNCWKECKVNELEEQGGFLARRLSGGGAVFHDLGNLNFTFISRKKHYNVDRQLSVILEALEKLSIAAQKTGRNDITVDGRKFSGNAFFESGDYCYHHGTLLVDVDIENMSKYLTVSKQKLQSKGVDSVRSRVVNLKELCPVLTIPLLTQKLKEAFALCYEGEVTELSFESLSKKELEKLEKKFASFAWRCGKRIPFQFEMSEQFSFGNLDLQFHINAGIVTECAAFSDAMDEAFIYGIGKRLTGCVYEEKVLLEAIESLVDSEQRRQMCMDIQQMIKKNM